MENTKGENKKNKLRLTWVIVIALSVLIYSLIAMEEEFIIQDENQQQNGVESENVINIQKDGKTVSILTYNIFIRPPFVVSNFNSDHKDERIAEIKDKVLPNFDIICFQELFRMFSLRASDLLKKSEQLGFQHAASEAKWSQFMFIDGGCITLSRFPIISSSTITYVPGVNSDRLAAKGAVYIHTRKDLGNGEYIDFHIFNTHLQASYDTNSSNQKNEEIRKDQLEALKMFIQSKVDQLPSENNIVLLCGDLNVNGRKSVEHGDQHSDGYLEMMERLSIDGYRMVDLLFEKTKEHGVTVGDGIEVDGVLLPRERKLTNASDYLCRKRLDYIILYERAKNPSSNFILEDCKIEPFFVDKKPYTQLSDHYGVSATLRL